MLLLIKYSIASMLPILLSFISILFLLLVIRIISNEFNNYLLFIILIIKNKLLKDCSGFGVWGLGFGVWGTTVVVRI
jgi:hypothetical protein